MAGPWEKFQAAPTSPIAITGPKAPAPQTAAQAQGDALSNARTQQLISTTAATAPFDAEIAAANARKAKADAAKAEREADPNANRDLEAVRAEALDKIRLGRSLIARSKSGTFATGALAGLARNIDGTTAFDVQSDTDTLKNAGALTRIMEMAKANGGKNPLTPLSNSDFQALANSLSNLETRQSDEQYQRNVGRVLDLYARAYTGAGGKDLEADLLATDPDRQKETSPLVIGVQAPPTAPNWPSGPVDPGARTISPDGSSNAPSDASRAFAQIASDAFMQGASRGEMDALAAKYGTPPFGPDLDRAIAMRDKGYRGPVYFKPPATEPTGPSVLGAMAASAPGAYFGQAANVLSAGTLDELAGALGGDAQQAQWAKEAMREAHPYASFAGDVTGAGLQAFGAGRIPALAARPVLTNMLLAGAYGAGENNNNRLIGGGLSAAGAGVLTRAGNALVDRIATRTALPPGGQQAVDLANAADQEGIRVSRPLLDPSRRDRMAYLEASPGSGEAIRAGLQNTTDDLEAAATRLGGGGIVQEGGDLGQRVQDAGQRYIDRSRGVGRRLYDRAAQMAQGATVRGQEAVRVLDENIAELSRNPNSNAPLINYLQEVRRDFVDEAGNLIAKDLGAIRDMRTTLRGQINNRNLTATDAERRVGQVLDAARTDIRRDLSQSAPQAVRQYDRADSFWRERQAEIRQVVQKVIGRSDDRLSGEQVMARLKTMASPGGDASRLQRMVDKLSPEERADYAATIAARLGRRGPEDAFSPALFVNSVRSLSPAARRTIFGADGARSIANLRSLAEAQRDTLARLNNSRSGMVQNWASFLRQFSGGGSLGSLGALAVGGDVLTTGGVGLALGAASAGAGAGLRNLSARALMSPDLSRWLAAAPRASNPAAIQRHIARLPVIAGRDPAIAQDVTALYRALSEAVNDNTIARAAASPQEGQSNDQR